MDKKTFCESLRALRDQYDHDVQWSNIVRKLFPSERIVAEYDNHRVNNQLLKILQQGMKDEGKDSWIEYFMFEIDYGRKYKKGCATDNGVDINLSAPEHLYDYLSSLNPQPLPNE